MDTVWQCRITRDAVLEYSRIRPDWGRAATSSRLLQRLIGTKAVYQSVRSDWVLNRDPDMQSIMTMVEQEESDSRRAERGGRSSPSSSVGS